MKVREAGPKETCTSGSKLSRREPTAVCGAGIRAGAVEHRHADDGRADMTKTALRDGFPALRVAALLAILTTSACSSLMHPTNAKSVAGLQPSGTVSITEDFVAGLGGGSGSLDYQGQSYPFQLLGTVVGPGGGLSKTTASGEVYKLSTLADFPGRYTQSTGAAGLNTSGSRDLWLQNDAGVIMHLRGTSTGAMLTLGREEVFVRMLQE